MNIKETAKLMDIMQLNYPDSFKGMTDETMLARVKLWASIFADDDYKTVQAAIMAHIASDTSRFMPPVGVIKQMLVKLTQPEELTESEAWALVARALRDGIYHAAERFAELPPICQRLVGSPAQLREWGMCESVETLSVAQSNFMRSYRARVKHEKELAALPESVKTLMLETRQLMQLKGSTERRETNGKQ